MAEAAKAQKTLNDRLVTAVKSKDEVAVRQLLQQGAQIGLPPGEPPLLKLAIEGGSISIVERLLDAGADIDVVYSYDCYYEYTEKKSYYEPGKAFIETRSGHACAEGTPLIHALAERNTEIATLLLDRGADITRTDTKGRTPLVVAVLTEQGSMVRRLLEKGASPEVKFQAYKEKEGPGRPELFTTATGEMGIREGTDRLFYRVFYETTLREYARRNASPKIKKLLGGPKRSVAQ